MIFITVDWFTYCQNILRKSALIVDTVQCNAQPRTVAQVPAPQPKIFFSWKFQPFKRRIRRNLRRLTQHRNESPAKVYNHSAYWFSGQVIERYEVKLYYINSAPVFQLDNPHTQGIIHPNSYQCRNFQGSNENIFFSIFQNKSSLKEISFGILKK